MVAHGIVAGMPGALTTTVTELEDSRVRLEVQVPAGDVEGRVERKAQQLGRDMKLPGFRRGKVPASLVIQRIGREAVLEEAVRDTLSTWYAQAIDEAGVVPVGDPELRLGELPPAGEALEFSIEIGVLPKAQLGQYRDLEVPRREVVLDEQLVEQEVQALRERLARLETVERPAEGGDFVVIDYRGFLPAVEGSGREPFAGGEGRDQLVELGGGNLIPGFEDGLLGAAAGETRTIELSFPDDYGADELAGKAASFDVTVKEVKRKELPELDDDFAVDTGFDDLDELREDIRGRLREAEEARVQAEFRQAALDAAVDGAQVALTPALVTARAREMWERTLHSLAHQGITREAYLRVLGREEQDLLGEMEPEADRALRREAVLTAVVEAEQIEPTEEEELAAVTPAAEREGVDPAQLLADLRRAGRLEDLREDLAARRAVELIAESARPIPVAQAQAREQLWTPEKAAQQAAGDEQAAAQPGQLWTPDR
jgi:trigger factor